MKKQIFPVVGMSCAGCSSSVESMLKTQDGVVDAGVNLANHTAWVEFDEKKIAPVKLQEVIRSIGYDLVIDTVNGDTTAAELREKSIHSLKTKMLFSAFLSLPVVILEMVFMHWPPANWISLGLSTLIIFWFGRTFFINAYKQARHLMASMDTLVALSTFVAYLLSVFNTIWPELLTSKGILPHTYFESASVIITFILLGKYLEEKAKGKTSSSIRKLMGFQPQTVTLVESDNLKVVPIHQVVADDIVLIKPGERIPVDGIVINGSSFVDESTITGEPLPVLKENGDRIFSGTLNQKGTLTIRAKQVGSETVLSHIIKMVEQAQGSKAKVQKLADRVAAIFVPIVLGIAMLSFILWFILGGNNGLIQGILAFVTVLAIACPCALGLATPTAIMVGVGKGAENSILIKDAQSLESTCGVNTVILDKTGTITEGKPEVVDIIWFTENKDINDYQSAILSIELLSEHPLADAVVSYLRNINVKPIKVDHFEAISGLGVRASIIGEEYAIGSERFITEKGIPTQGVIAERSKIWVKEGYSIMYVALANRILSVIGVTDKIKSSSPGAVSALKEMGIEVIMLTGDGEATASKVASLTGIKVFESGMLPHQKGSYVKRLQAEGKIVAMIGDGINDSEALAQADVSFAMGKGSDIAMDVAKITLITSDLNYVAKAIRLSDRTMKTIKQNLFWAFFYNVIGIPIAAGILYPLIGFQFDPMIAGVAMAFSSITVVSNSLRLNRYRLK